MKLGSFWRMVWTVCLLFEGCVERKRETDKALVPNTLKGRLVHDSG